MCQHTSIYRQLLDRNTLELAFKVQERADDYLTLFTEIHFFRGQHMRHQTNSPVKR